MNSTTVAKGGCSMRGVLIGRPTKWGNPFNMLDHGGRERCVRLFAEWVVKQPHLMADLHELQGQQLLCYCKPLLCHGDVLALLADGTPADSIDLWLDFT